jgi:rhodanese-related sulfurtransferase
VAKEYRRALQSVVLLVLLSTILGLGSNVVRSPSLPILQPLPSLFPGEISLPDAHQLFQAQTARFWDVRSVDSYQKAHLPEALSPEETPGPGQTLVVYCSGRLCPKAQAAAERLRSEGYRDVRVMPDGINGWHAAGYPLQRKRR